MICRMILTPDKRLRVVVSSTLGELAETKDRLSATRLPRSIVPGLKEHRCRSTRSWRRRGRGGREHVLGLLDELSVRLRLRHMPRLQEEIELHPDVVMPHRGESRDLDCVGPDLLGDVVPLCEVGNEAAEIGCVLNSNFHRSLFPWFRQPGLRNAACARGISPYSMRVGPKRTELEGGPTWLI
jgi:hypothetical protein